MQHYLEQLIGDLRSATWNVRPPHELWSESEADPDDFFGVLPGWMTDDDPF